MPCAWLMERAADGGRGDFQPKAANPFLRMALKRLNSQMHPQSASRVALGLKHLAHRLERAARRDLLDQYRMVPRHDTRGVSIKRNHARLAQGGTAFYVCSYRFIRQISRFLNAKSRRGQTIPAGAKYTLTLPRISIDRRAQLVA